MPGSSSPPRHRRVDRVSRRAKVAATAIAVVTMLLTIAMAMNSHRIVEAWRGHVGFDRAVPVGQGMPAKPGRTTARGAVRPTPQPTPTASGRPGSAQRATSDRPPGTPAAPPAWLGTVAPACDQPATSGSATPQPSTVSSPAPGPTPTPSSTAPPATTSAAPSTSDYSTPCLPSTGGAAPSTPVPTPSTEPLPLVNQ
jgi:hypothetical protein